MVRQVIVYAIILALTIIGVLTVISTDSRSGHRAILRRIGSVLIFAAFLSCLFLLMWFLGNEDIAAMSAYRKFALFVVVPVIGSLMCVGFFGLPSLIRSRFCRTDQTTRKKP